MVRCLVYLSLDIDSHSHVSGKYFRTGIFSSLWMRGRTVVVLGDIPECEVEAVLCPRLMLEDDRAYAV